MKKNAEKINVAAIQLNSSQNSNDNLEIIIGLIKKAAHEGAEYIQTPEMSNVLTKNKQILNQQTNYPDNCKFSQSLCQVAKELSIMLHVGSVAQKYNGDKFLNRSLVINHGGSIIATYDKKHLFNANIAENERYAESDTYVPGEKEVCIPITPNTWKLGLAICFDIRFSTHFYQLKNMGANIMTMPAAFTQKSGEKHWHILNQARAIEFQSYVVSAAQTGQHEDGSTTFGHSLIISPHGEIIKDAQTKVGVIHAELNVNEIKKAKYQIPMKYNTSLK